MASPFSFAIPCSIAVVRGRDDCSEVWKKYRQRQIAVEAAPESAVFAFRSLVRSREIRSLNGDSYDGLGLVLGPSRTGSRRRLVKRWGRVVFHDRAHQRVETSPSRRAINEGSEALEWGKFWG